MEKSILIRDSEVTDITMLAAVYDKKSAAEQEKYLRDVFCLPEEIAYRWHDREGERRFEAIWRTTVKSACQSGKNAAQLALLRADEVEGTKMPIVANFYDIYRFGIYLIVQKFLYDVEEKGYTRLAFIPHNAEVTSALYVMQQYGWHIEHMAQIPWGRKGPAGQAEPGRTYYTPGFILTKE